MTHSGLPEQSNRWHRKTSNCSAEDSESHKTAEGASCFWVCKRQELLAGTTALSRASAMRDRSLDKASSECLIRTSARHVKPGTIPDQGATEWNQPTSDPQACPKSRENELLRVSDSQPTVLFQSPALPEIPAHKWRTPSSHNAVFRSDTECSLALPRSRFSSFAVC